MAGLENVTLIRGRHVLTFGPKGAITDGAVAIKGNRVADVGDFRALSEKYADAAIEGGKEAIVLPGFVNAHTHFSEGMLSGMCENMTLFEWGAKLLTPTAPYLTREVARIGTILKGAELISTGVTTVNDMFCHACYDEGASLGVVDGLEEIGLNGVVSFGAEDLGLDGKSTVPVNIILEEHRALAERAKAAGVGFRLGIGTVLGQSDALFEASIALAKKNVWGVHTHLAEVREEKVCARLRWGSSTVEHAAKCGLLDLDVVAGHGIWLDDSEIALLSSSGARIVYNPVANMILADGVCDLRKLCCAGVGLGLGTDGAASNDSQNMLEAIKFGALLQKVNCMDPSVVFAEKMLHMATIGGATVLGLGAGCGSLEVGKRADVVVFSGNWPGTAIVHDPYQQIVYGASPRDVSDVWIGGVKKLENGRLVGIDLPSVIEKARTLAKTISNKSKIKEFSCLA
jgi:5-methylthioadenosine/S-adenosylhomocysteine deaminase